MSTYKGKIKPLNVLKGKIKDRLQGLNVRITPINPAHSVKITPAAGYKGEWRTPASFGASVRRLMALFRFLSANVRFWAKHDARAGTAPAIPMDAESDFHTGKEAAADARPAEELTAKHTFRDRMNANLAAYNRAAASFIRDILTRYLARIIPAASKVLNHSKGTAMHSESVIDAADSAIFESVPDIAIVDVAAASKAPAETAAAADSFTAESAATPNRAGTVDVFSTGSAQHTAKKAGMFTWFLPERTGGVLTLFQIYSGVQNGDSVEIDTESESVYWANNINRVGVLSLVFAQTEPQNDDELKVI